MKKIILLSLAVFSLTLWSCEKQNSDDNTPDEKTTEVKSWENAMIVGGQVHFKYVYTPTFDASGRITGVNTEHYEGTALVEKIAETYSWNASAKTGSLKGTDTWYDDGGSTNTYSQDFKLDDDLNILSMTSSGYTSNYQYQNGYMVLYVEQRETLEWKDGDLASITSNFNRKTFKYSSDKNPFADSVDPVFRDILPSFYELGFGGKRSAHLVSEYTDETDNDGFKYTSVCRYSYKKDSQGRITEINTYYVDPETGKPFENDAEHVVRINYK